MKKDLAQAEQEVLKARIKAERAILKDIEDQYKGAITEINLHLAQLLGRQDANLPHVIHQVEYQRMLKQQVQASLDKLHSQEYESVTAYLNESYTDAFVGTVYTLHHQDMPVILPINQALAVKAITLDTKLKKTMYEEMGKDINQLKRTIQQEITRGISSGMMYSEIARNISNQAGIPMRRAKTIARTEGGRVQEQASYDAALQAKEKGANLVKQWNAIRDGKTRDAHRALHNQTRELDEPFEIDGEEAMHPHDFGQAYLDCNCRCTMLTLAKASLDADTLKQMEAEADFHKLRIKDTEKYGKAQVQNLSDFKKKYLKASEESTKKVHTVDDVNRKATDALLKAYDDRRVHFGMNTAPAEEMRKLAFNPFTADYSGLSVQTADAFNDAITKLSSEYYTGFTRIEVADPKKVFGTHVFASTTHNTAVGQSTLVINPLKTKDYDKMIERVEELSKKGYAVELASGKAGEYIATHEFAHSLFDMKSPLKNYVGMNVKPIQQARKEIESIYSRYTKEVKELEKTFKGLESKILLADDLDEMSTLQSKAMEAKINLKSVQISQYSMETSDEFMAEAFTQAKIGSTQSPYTAEVMAVIDKLFKK